MSPAMSPAMSQDPPIGIVIPARDAAPWLGAALRSVLAQTLATWRVAVVDDGSTDPTATVAAGFTDPRITLIRQAPCGVSAARNRGIAALTGCAALLFLDADDWLAPDALARLAAALRAAPDAVAACGPCAPATEDGRPAGRALRPAAGDVLARLLTRNLFANGGHLLVRTAAVHRAGGFRPDLRYGEDWEYWVRIAALGRFVAAPGRAPLLFVRRRAEGAYLRAAADPAAFAPAMAAAFAAPALAERFGPRRLARLRRRMAAETEWVAGRALLWHGRRAEALGRLRRSWIARPGLRRAALLALWQLGGNAAARGARCPRNCSLPAGGRQPPRDAASRCATPAPDSASGGSFADASCRSPPKEVGSQFAPRPALPLKRMAPSR